MFYFHYLLVMAGKVSLASGFRLNLVSFLRKDHDPPLSVSPAQNAVSSNFKRHVIYVFLDMYVGDKYVQSLCMVHFFYMTNLRRQTLSKKI